MTGEWVTETGVTCVVCPACAFTFDAIHTDVGGGYSCPQCQVLALPHLSAALAEERDDLYQRLLLCVSERDIAQAALRDVLDETGTSTRAHHIARDALAENETYYVSSPGENERQLWRTRLAALEDVRELAQGWVDRGSSYATWRSPRSGRPG